MKETLQVFHYTDPKAGTETIIRAVPRENSIWFAASDVCAALGIKNSRDAVRRLDEDEKGVGITDTLGGEQKRTVVNESGLYRMNFPAPACAVGRIAGGADARQSMLLK